MASWTIVSTATSTDVGKYFFSHYNSSNSNLSYDTVNKIIQDKYGFIWIGTSSGLSRFNGVDFRNYYKEDFGLSSDMVISLETDDEGKLWIATDSGVTVYDPVMESFTPFYVKSDIGTTINHKANDICKGPDGRIWFSVNKQGLFSYNPKTKKLKNYFFKNGKQTFPVNIRRFTVDSNNRLWISLYNDNLYYTDPGYGKLIPFLGGTKNGYFHNDDIMAISIKPMDDNVVYVCSVMKGLCELDVQQDKVNVLIPATKGISPEDIFIDKEKRVWMATTNGVYIYDTKDKNVRLINEDKNDPFSLSDSHAFAVYVDSYDGLWIGTNVGGVNYSGRFQQNFSKYYFADGTSLDNCLVRGFADDDKGNIWITTEKDGLLVYDINSKKLSRYANRQLPQAMFAVSYYDGKLWIGTLKGLYVINPGTGKVEVHESLQQSEKVTDSKVYSLYRTKKGQLLIGTTLGLVRYDSKTNSFTPLEDFSGMFVTDMDEDPIGHLWVSTYANGILEYDQQKSRILHHYVDDERDPNTIPSDKIFSILVDSKGRIWAASFGGGFCRLDPNTGKSVNYSKNNTWGVRTNNFFGIEEDDNGYLWISSDKGLLCLNPENGEIRRYTEYDGLLSNEFKNCGLKTEDGDIYFGCKNGFIRFNPRLFVQEPGQPKILVRDFSVGSIIVLPLKSGSPLNCNVDLADKIVLSPRQNSFSFGLSMFGSSSPESNLMLYKLEGYDKEWRVATAESPVFYYNVPSGEYTLKIKGASVSDNLNVTHKDIVIVVAKRFYKTAVAFVLYALILILLALGIFTYVYKKAMRREKDRRKRFEKEKEEELFEQKMTFFSTIVHEIKTPLTLIKTPLMNILSSGKIDDECRDDLSVIRNSTDYMDHLVKELLDFVRIERNGYVIDRKVLDIVEPIGLLCFNYADTAKTKNIKLSFTHDQDRIFVNADESAINKILNNLLHNAVKYAESYIDIHASADKDMVVITISNDGPSIPADRRADIFKPFVQFSNDRQPYSQSFGIGLSIARKLADLSGGSLVLSENADKTSFVFEMPLSPLGKVSVAEEAESNTSEDSSLPLLMIVEDNKELSSYLKRKLSLAYRIVTSDSAERALAMLRQYDVDLLISDIALQSMSGIELCKRVSSDFDLSHIPIIIVSAISSEDTKIECLKNGALMYIEKPFTIDYLKTCIKSVLDKRASLKQGYDSSSFGDDNHQYDLLGLDEEFLKRLDQVISDNLKDPAFSSKQIEEALFLSRSTLIRKVKALLDTTPNDYLRSKRLSTAATLLAQKRCRISDVCYAVGFNSPSYFAKCFKDKYGMLPAEFQKVGKNPPSDQPEKC